MSLSRCGKVGMLLALAAATTLPAGAAEDVVFGSTTQLVSVTLDGTGTGGYSRTTSVSRNGRYVAFCSTDPRLVSGDTNETWDVFVRDLKTERTVLVSAGVGGQSADGISDEPMISAGGDFVTFSSEATNLVTRPVSGWQVYIRDLEQEKTVLVSVNDRDVPGNDSSRSPQTSTDGRTVAFASYATDLVSGDTNGEQDVFVRDLDASTTTRISVAPGDQQVGRPSGVHSISASGRFVAFSSGANGIVPSDRDGRKDAFVRNLELRTTRLVSRTSNGTNIAGPVFEPVLSPGARCVVFTAASRKVVRHDNNGVRDVFLRNLRRQTTRLVSRNSAEVIGDDTSRGGSVASGCRRVAFTSQAKNLAVGSGFFDSDDIFVRNLRAGTTTWVSVPLVLGDKEQVRDGCWDAMISGDGAHVTFDSYRSGLVPETNHGGVFIRSR